MNQRFDFLIQLANIHSIMDCYIQQIKDGMLNLLWE